MPIPQFNRASSRRKRRRTPSPIPDIRRRMVNPAGYQEPPPSAEAVAKDAELSDNCALLQRARAEDPDNCRDDEMPALLTRRPRRR